MALVKLKPTSAGRRSMVKVVNSDLYKGRPYAPLIEKQSRNGGRNNNGQRMAGQLGAVTRTTQGLEVVKVDLERQLLLVKGAVPGSRGGDVFIRPAVKAGS